MIKTKQLAIIFVSALAVLSSASNAMDTEMTLADVIAKQSKSVTFCDAKEIGKITKVSLATGKKVAEITKGNMEVEAAKNFVVIKAKRGGLVNREIYQIPVSSEVTAKALSKELKGKPTCVFTDD